MSILLSKNTDICPLFGCQVSQRDIYYVLSYAEIIKICDILMADFRVVWPRRDLKNFTHLKMTSERSKRRDFFSASFYFKIDF